jgi:hypothetical protein
MRQRLCWLSSPALDLPMTFCRVQFLPALLCVATALLAQTSTTVLVPPHDSLLPPSFGAWTTVHPSSPAAEPSMSLANASKAALSEDNPQRSEVVDYAGPGGRSLHVEAVEFADYTGAWSAYTLLRAPGLKDSKDLSSKDAVGQDAILFLSGHSGRRLARHRRGYPKPPAARRFASPGAWFDRSAAAPSAVPSCSLARPRLRPLRDRPGHLLCRRRCVGCQFHRLGPRRRSHHRPLR